jgi:hypothetical protein
MVARRTAAGGELRAETTASVTGSSGGGVLAPPPDLEGARRWTRSRPEPARRGARPGGTLVPARRWEPKRLRLLAVAGRLVRNGRRT